MPFLILNDSCKILTKSKWEKEFMQKGPIRLNKVLGLAGLRFRKKAAVNSYVPIIFLLKFKWKEKVL